MNTQHYTCSACGQPWSRVAARGRVPRYCPTCRAALLGTVIATCAWCGNTTDMRRDATYCSRTCAGQARTTSPPEFCRIPANHPVRQRRPKPRTWHTGQCLECGAWFVDRQRSRYCSPVCRKNKDRRNWRERTNRRIPAATRRAVYARDNGTCQLCLTTVDMTLMPTHPMGPTLDHIECQSWSLIPDHRAGNLRLAHRLCNSLRGNSRVA